MIDKIPPKPQFKIEFDKSYDPLSYKFPREYALMKRVIGAMLLVGILIGGALLFIKLIVTIGHI